MFDNQILSKHPPHSALLLAGVFVVLASCVNVDAQTIANSGFEAPVLASNSFQELPTGSSWTMGGEAGIAKNGSSLGNPSSPQGTQVLYLRRVGTAAANVIIPSAGCYTLKFKSAQGPGSNQTFKVIMDGTTINYVQPIGTAFSEIILPDIFLPVGNQYIEFVGVNPLAGDNTAFVDDITLTKNPTVQTVANSGFETPTLASNTFQYAPVGSGWTFTSGGGIASNGSAFGNVTAREGSQVLFLQNGGSAQRAVNFTTAGTYRIAIKAAQRSTQNQSIKISIDGAVIDVITPPNRFFTDYFTADVTLAAGNRILRLEGTNPLGTDNTAFVDAINIEKMSAPQNWSSPATWPGGVVPATGSAVVIPPGKTVVLDQNIAVDSIVVGGTLRFARQNLIISVCSIISDGPAARIEIGTEQSRFTQNVEITLTGGVCTAPSNCQCSIVGHEMTDGNVISAINGGVLDIHGANVTSWTKLGATANANTSTLTLAAPVVGWTVGAEIMITSSTSNWNQGETRTITAISGQTITLNSPLTNTHVGVQQSYSRPSGTPRTWNLDMRAEVGLLSRNITIQGDANALTTGFGGHLMIMKSGSTLAGSTDFVMGGRGYVEGAELYRMGRKSVKGKYPLHFHMLGEEGKGQYFRNNSVHRSNNRAIVIHGTESTQVSNNFCYDHIGHGLMLEDGAERFNRITSNVMALTRRPASLAEAVTPSDIGTVDAVTGVVAGSALQVSLPASYWITNPNNTVDDNVAAGTEGTGMWLLFVRHPVGQSETDVRFASQVPSAEPLGSLKRTVSHSSYCGLQVNGDLESDHSLIRNRGTQFAGGILIEDATLYANNLGHYGGLTDGSDPGLATFRGFSIADCNYALMQANNSLMEDSLVVADTGLNLLTTIVNPGTLAPGVNRSYELSYDGPTRGRNNHLVGFNTDNTSILAVAGGSFKHTNASFAGFTFSPPGPPRLEIADLNARTAAGPLGLTNPRKWSVVFRDLDGSVSGKANSSIIFDHPFMRTSTDIRPFNWVNATRSDHKFAYTTINAAASYGDFADMTVSRQRAGEPDVNLYFSSLYGVQVELPLIVNEDYYYTFKLHSIPTNNSITFNIGNVAPGDFVKARFTSFGSFPGSRVNSATSVSSMTALDNATANAYFKDSSGSIWVKIFQAAGLNAHETNGCSIVWDSNGTLPVVDTDADGMGDFAEANALRDPISASDFASQFDTVGNAEGWTALNAATQSLNGTDYLVSATATGNPSLSRSGLAFTGSAVGSISVRYKSEGSRTLRLYWSNEDGPLAETRALYATTAYVANSDYKIATFDLAGNANWAGKTISSLRLDLMGGTGVQTWVDWIRSSDELDLDGDGVKTRAELDAGRNPSSAVDFGFEFNTSSQDGWTFASTSLSSMTGSEFLVRASTTGAPSLSRNGLSMKGSEVGNISVRLKSEGSRTVRLYWANENGNLAEVRGLNATTSYTANSGYKIITFNLANHPEWLGKTITALRIDLMGGNNNGTWIDWIRAGDGSVFFASLTSSGGSNIFNTSAADKAVRANFSNVILNGGRMSSSVTFDVQTGIRYRMMASPDLSPASWHQINEFTADKNERVVMPYNSTLPNEFYRLELVSPGAVVGQ